MWYAIPAMVTVALFPAIAAMVSIYGLFAEPAQQAKTLVAAAKSGTPFCEICGS